MTKKPSLFSEQSSAIDPNSKDTIERIFASVKQIRAVNTDNALPADFISYGFLNHLIEAILNDMAFYQQYKTKAGIKGIASHQQFAFLIAALTDQFQVGNCGTQATLAICKLLAEDIDLKLTRVDIEGRGKLNKEAETILANAPKTHSFVLIDHDEDFENGYLFDTWALEKVEPNPGIDQFAKSLGFEQLDIPDTLRVFEEKPTAADWHHVATFFDFMHDYLTDSKLNELFPSIKKSALQELRLFFGASKLDALKPLIDNFSSAENLSAVNKTLHAAFSKWRKLAEKKSHSPQPHSSKHSP